MKKLVLACAIAFGLGSASAGGASGLLTETIIPAALCTGAGYAGMSADYTVIMVCTSDGMMHVLEAR